LQLKEGPQILAACRKSAEKQGLYVQSSCYVSSKQGTNPNRVMLYMGKEQGVTEETHLVLSTPDSPRSETYARLTADFYL
jgi:tRNA1(Val) A37 N6-methylase TrmN6